MRRPISRTTKGMHYKDNRDCKEQDEHKANHEKVKTKEDNNIIAMNQSTKILTFKLKKLPIIGFIFPMNLMIWCNRKILYP